MLYRGMFGASSFRRYIPWVGDPRVVSRSRLRLMAGSKGQGKAAMAVDASELEKSGMPRLRTIASEEGGHPG